MANKNTDFLPVLKTWKEQLATRPPEEGMTAILLAFHCNEQFNGGRIDNASAFLGNEVSRGLAGLSQDAAALASRDSQFWHWEDDTLVVDLYSVYHEKKIITMRENRRKGGLASGKARKKQRRERMAKALKDKKPRKGNTCSSTCSTPVQALVEQNVKQERKNDNSFSNEKENYHHHSIHHSSSVIGSAEPMPNDEKRMSVLTEEDVSPETIRRLLQQAKKDLED